ncbi:hypothetical protein [Hasllibacter sp. MH4015]|uniref:hypothetical protein n=1 Tax=Hasllibacter sp. MH4015 TaxID=2854029 RepID=UPI001CD4023C|nr:hypothetical protein [Hasllibacter sp. MH4015]
MTKILHLQPRAPRMPMAEPTARPPDVLAVSCSDIGIDAMPRHILSPDARLRRARLGDVTAQTVTGPGAPDLILSPLLSRGFDAMDLLTTLRELRYGGRYLVVAPGLHHVGLIRWEMQSSAPDLNVDIVSLNGKSVLHLAQAA